MDKGKIEYRVMKTGLNGEVAVIKEGEEVKVVPAVIFNETQAEKLLNIAHYQAEYSKGNNRKVYL